MLLECTNSVKLCMCRRYASEQGRNELIEVHKFLSLVHVVNSSCPEFSREFHLGMEWIGSTQCRQ